MGEWPALRGSEPRGWGEPRSGEGAALRPPGLGNSRICCRARQDASKQEPLRASIPVRSALVRFGMRVERTDVTKWLIHFVRERDPETGPHAGENDDPVSSVLDAKAGPAEVLKSILQEGALRPGWSFRGGRPTIYGGRPAVCFTEMPLLSLAMYAKERQRTRVAPFGIGLLKRELYAAGARPVISGLSVDEVNDSYDPPFKRMLPEDVLPKREQYRYVALNPGASTPIDWTHEREWRWTPREDDAHRAWLRVGANHLPALPLFRHVLPAAAEVDSPKGFFSRVAIIVDKSDDADAVINQLHAMRDSKGSDYGEVFDPKVIAESFVVVLEDVERLAEGPQRPSATRIETLPASCSRRIGIPTVPEARLSAARTALEAAKSESHKAALEHLNGRDANDVRDVCGGAWVVTDEGAHPNVQALVELGAAHASGDGYYRVDAVDDRVGGQALSVAEALARGAAEVLTKQLGVCFYVRSWRD